MKMWHMLKIEDTKHRNLQKDNLNFGWMSFEWMELMKHKDIETYSPRNKEYTLIYTRNDQLKHPHDLKVWFDIKTNTWYRNMDIETWPWNKNIPHDMKDGLDAKT
jgi:hypothetical protein